MSGPVAGIANGNQPRRVALVGCGAIARSHAAAIENLEGLELAAVVDTDPEALERAEGEFAASAYSSVEVLLAEAARDGGIEVRP